MRAILAKYLALFKNSWQNQLEYRLNNLIFIVIAAVSLVSVFFLWNDVFGDRAVLAGYSREKVVTYYVLITFLFASIYRSLNVANAIQTGYLSSSLVQPFNYLWGVYWTSLAERLFRLAAGLPLLLAIFLLWHDHLYFVTDPWTYLVLGLTVLGGINILFLIDLAIDLQEFWFKDAPSLRYMLDMIVRFFSGALIPLALMPPAVNQVGAFLPFSYSGAFIVDAFLGQLPAGRILLGVGVQALWTAGLLAVVLTLWRRGLKRYEAFGN